MRDQLSDAVKNHQADYVEIRVERSESTIITYRGKRLEEIARTASYGGNARALVKGGWGFVSFDSFTGLWDTVETAVMQARIASRDRSYLAPVPPAIDLVKAEPVKDPTKLPLAAKKDLLERYNNIILGTPKIQTSFVNYHDGRKTVYFANSEGAYIEQEKVDLGLRLTAIARKDADVQQAGISLGSNRDFGVVENLGKEVKETADKAVALLAAPQAKGAEYTVVLDPVLAGVFVHEAFGHLSEADAVYENPKLKEIMVLGRKFGGKHLNIVDGAAVPNLRATYKYDDEGTPSTRTYLVRDGVLEARLHSRETAARMKEKPTGNARSIGYNYPPIVRMTNTFIEPGKLTFDDIIADIKEGIYAKEWYGGTTSLEMFTFSAGEAYMIRNGKVAEMLRPVVLTGNVFTTLHNIDAIGNDLAMNEGGGCGKGEQSPLPVTNGSPHIRMIHCLVGGA
jgi:TldD protein